MRRILMILPLAMLAACTTPPSQSGIQNNAAQTGAPGASVQTTTIFTVPMDPGLIPCAALNNPTALNVATEWTMGQARAAALTGRIATTPDTTSVASNLTSFCTANRDETIRAAAKQLGF